MPDHPAAWEALARAEESLPAAILFHSFRTYIYAKAFLDVQIADRPRIDAREAASSQPGSRSLQPLHAIFAACLYHDLGTSTEFDQSPLRFEIDGADEMANLLRTHGTDEDAIHDSWLAVTLHDTPGVPDRLGGSVRAVRPAIRADFGAEPPAADQLPAGISTKADLEAILPRLDVEKVLGDAVVRQGLENLQQGARRMLARRAGTLQEGESRVDRSEQAVPKLMGHGRTLSCHRHSTKRAFKCGFLYCHN